MYSHFILSAFFLLFPYLSHAAISRIVIERREPFANGHEFPVTGAYEKLVGKAYGEVDPKSRFNKIIVNLDKAPRNQKGMVEYWADLYILKPVDMKRGNRTLFYEVVNRGNKGLRFNVGAVRSNDPTTLSDAGDGFLMRRGYTLVWSGWQGDIRRGGNRMTAGFPIAVNRDGSSIRRWVRTEFVFQKPSFSVPLSFDREALDILPYPAVEESMSKARLSRRSRPHEVPQLIPNDQWSFARCPDGKTRTPSNTNVCLPSAFSPNYIYELVYEAQDPIVMGLGFAAARDIISYLRYDAAEGNPLSQTDGNGMVGVTPRWGIGFGSSQSGRFLKDFLYQGFNQDEAGRIVFDGLIPHLSGSRRTFLNYEFAMPGRFPTALEGHYYPGDHFPFTYETLMDPISKKRDGVLSLCRKQKVCPKIMHWDSGTEAWQARNSLVVTEPRGKADAPVPENVRLYFFSSTQHGPVEKPARDMCQQLSNPLSYQETQRALLVALQDWVTQSHEPPPTRFPRLSDGTLVPSLPQAAQGFPRIPGVTYKGKFNDLFINDQKNQPPKHIPGTEYGVFVPKVDADGNEIAGVRSVAVQVPIGTYSGWNLRITGFIEDELCYLNGSYIPFAGTKEEREKSGDPRLSLEERYKDQADYVQKVSRAAGALMEERLLLLEDAERIIAEAKKRALFEEKKAP